MKDVKKEDPSASADKVMKSIIVVALGSFMFFFVVMVSSFGNIIDSNKYSPADTPQVLGASTATEVTEPIAVQMNNATVGEGVLEMVLSEPVAIAGAEFHFYLDGNTDFRGIVCSSEFECIEQWEEDTYSLTLFRLPDLADIPMEGTVKVATLLYAADTGGELVGNSDFTLQSKVLGLGSTENLLTTDVFYLALGSRTF